MVPPLGAISPHLDDLALSCGRRLAAHPGSTMVTVFAGGPATVDPVTGWESLSGVFEAGADIVGTRRTEDAEAALLLGCSYRHLDHWDEQYRHRVYGYQGPRGDDLIDPIAAGLEELVSGSTFTTWLVPLGIGHPDHELTAAACLTVVGRLPEVEWLVYEDLPYAAYDPRRAAAARDRLRARGFDLETPDDAGDGPLDPAKLDVINCYRSQIGPLGEGVSAALRSPERVGRLRRSR